MRVNANDFDIDVVTTAAGTGGTVEVLTSGVSWPGMRVVKRVVSSGVFEERFFDRLRTADSCGEIVSIGPEVIVQTATISGSGSASGGFL